jgi:hypothetical protein
VPWRRWRFVRDGFGRIVSIRSATDPWWDQDFLRDPEVREFFAEVDRRHDAAERKRRGVPELTNEERAAEQEYRDHAEASLRARFAWRRRRR